MSLRCEQRRQVRVLTIDRPHKRNAIDEALADALCVQFDKASQDESVHVVVLASTGDVYLSGGDLGALQALPTDSRGAQAVIGLGLKIAAIERCAVPVVAAIHGDVYGGGCELVLHTDEMVMDAFATLSFVHRKMGLVPAWGGLTRLVERVGGGRATELLLSARRLGADEALAIGLVQRVVERGTALESAMELADELAKAPRESLVAMKRSLLDVRRATRGDALEQEQKNFRRAWGSAAHRAAMARFVKRGS